VQVRLADGEWHRLHPATPLLRGGIAFVAILGIVIVNLRDVLIQIVIGAPDEDPDPFVWIIEHDYAGPIVLAVFGGLLLFVAGFYVSWRMHTFRVTEEQLEVRSGILFRTHRRGRLDRIQGINIVRPLLARVFGAAKLEVTVAGQDANIPLAYLGSSAADELRREILLLASGSVAEPSSAAPAAARPGGIVGQRARELLAPERAPDVAPPASVVQMHLGRLLGSLLLSGFTVFVVVGTVAAIVLINITREYFFLFVFLPTLIGFGGFYVSRFTRSLRYSIAGTPDGIRVGFGLLSTSNETLPPGRIHAVAVSQPLLWRAAGWWEIKINRASTSSASGAAGQANTTILPVGNLEDVRRVLQLVLPSIVDPEAIALLERGLTSPGGDDGFTTSPRRAAVIRWFSWRRNGFALVKGAVLLRRGRIWRSLVIAPEARLQSIGIHQGPLERALDVASIRLHTVAGPISVRVGAIDRADALAAFEQIAGAAVSSADADTSHRWRSSAPREAEA
jgi:putative membrane protein